MNTAMAQSIGGSADSSGVTPGAASGQRTGEEKPSREFDSHMRDDDNDTSRSPSQPQSSSRPMTQTEAKKAATQVTESSGEKSAAETKKSNVQGDNSSSGNGQKPVMNHILRQLVKQNPGAQPPALQFIQGSLPGNAIEELPQLMASSRFITDALMEQDLSSYMGEDVKPSSVLRELGFSPDLITQALALGVDGGGPAQRAQVLSALGADPKRVESSLTQLKSAIAADGIAGYMQQTLALAKTSGKQPGIVEKLTGTEVDDTASDLGSFKANTSLEVQAIMAQALASASSWGPRAMARPSGSFFGSFDISAGMSALSLDMPSSLSVGSFSMSEVTDLTFTTAPSPDSSLDSALDSSLDSSVDSSLTDVTSRKTDIMSLENVESRFTQPGADAIIGFENLRSRLESEFGSNVKVTGLGARAWDETNDVDVASMTGLSAPEVSVTESTATGFSATPELQTPVEGLSSARKDNASHSDAGSNGEKDQPAGRPLVNARFPEMEARNPEVSEQEPRQAQQAEQRTEQVAAPLSDALPLNPLVANDVQPAVEVAESPGTGKSERVEVNARHATETVRKIQDAVMRTSVNNIGAMRLDLSSPETGKLEIAVRLDQRDGNVDVRVMAGSDELRELISRELPQLKSALGEQNLNLRNFESREWSGQWAGNASQWSGQQDFRGFGNGRGNDSAADRTRASGARSAGAQIQSVNEQLGRQALRSFRVVDLSDRSVGGAGRIKVLA
ncbi:flagellar hook-length control protein FliK [bacterium]|nr:flagellar hook-length control protein FliK [bacterium]